MWASFIKKVKMDNLNEGKIVERSTEVFFLGIFCVASIFLLSQLGEQCRFSREGKLFSQPAFWPAVGVMGMFIFSAIHILFSRRKIVFVNVLTELSVWLSAVEFLVWFMAYVFLVPVLGYLISTLLFMSLLALRMGYRGIISLLTAAMMGFIIVFFFKTILSVKIPGGLIYEFLPGVIRNFMIINF